MAATTTTTTVTAGTATGTGTGSSVVNTAVVEMRDEVNTDDSSTTDNCVVSGRDICLTDTALVQTSTLTDKSTPYLSPAVVVAINTITTTLFNYSQQQPDQSAASIASILTQIVNAQDAAGKTLLIHAIENQQYDTVQCLLNYGSDRTIKDVQGNTAWDYTKTKKKKEGEEEEVDTRMKALLAQTASTSGNNSNSSSNSSSITSSSS